MGPGPSNPGFVMCGSTQCDLTTQICCASNPAGPTCVASMGVNTGTCPGFDLEACDEPEDCPAGELCVVTSSNPIWTKCTTAAYPTKVCKTNQDCGDAGGGICVTKQSCNNHSIYVSTCGVEPWCADHP
jgi:hypothetical protein